MIEDKELGLKIADNPDQAFWIDLKKKCEKDIKTFERETIMSQRMILLAEEKIKETEE